MNFVQEYNYLDVIFCSIKVQLLKLLMSEACLCICSLPMIDSYKGYISTPKVMCIPFSLVHSHVANPFLFLIINVLVRNMKLVEEFKCSNLTKIPIYAVHV